MASLANLDILDRAIVACLQVDARVGYTVIAAVLGEQERTVARRAERLIELGLIRLTAFLDELRTSSGQPVTLRITVEPGAIDDVAGALSDRADTRAVMAVTGDSDVNCELVAPDKATLHRVLADELPFIRGIRQTRTFAVLRHVKPASEWRLPVLDLWQVEALRGPTPTPGDADDAADSVGIGPSELVLIDELQQNARRSYTELGARLGVTSTTARRRVDRLLARGVVTLRATVEPELLGLPVEADIWLDVRPAAITSTATALAARPEVSYCGVLAGSFAIELVVVLEDLSALYEFMAEVIGALPDVRGSEPTLITHTYKRGYLRTDGGVGHLSQVVAANGSPA